jgi:hypothetical protein
LISTIQLIAQKCIRPLRDAVREAFQAQYYPLGYVPAHDGMRGIMTVGVVVAHVAYHAVPGAVLFILWPVTFACLVRRFGLTWRLVIAIVAIGASIWVWRVLLVSGGANWSRLYTALDTRADALMVEVRWR